MVQRQDEGRGLPRHGPQAQRLHSLLVKCPRYVAALPGEVYGMVRSNRERI